MSLETVRKERLQEQKRVEDDTEIGTYHGLTVIQDKEKCDAAGLNYAKNCARLLKEGIKFRGKELVRWNGMTERTEFLYVVATYRSSLTNLWVERAVYKDIVASTIADAAAGTAPAAAEPAARATAPEATADSTKGEAAAKTQSKAKAKGKAGAKTGKKHKGKEADEAPEE